MVRGCQRKVIFLKNTESEIFSEAYFIVDARSTEHKEADMIREANRIVENSLSQRSDQQTGKRGVRRILKATLKSAPSFILGAVVATVLCLVFL